MKSWFNIYIFIALYCFGMTSCTDESVVESGNLYDEVVVRLTLSVPGADSRVGGDYQWGGTKADSLDAETIPQRYIKDAYILLFNNSDHTLIASSSATLDANQGGETRTIKGQFTKQNSSLDIVVLTNLEHNGITPTFTVGETEENIYKSLVYEYPKTGDAYTPWTIGENGRFLPMWGVKRGVTLNQRELTISSFDLYRGVAKMGVQVATTAQEKFTLKEVYVYHVNSKGYCAAPTKRPDVGDTNNDKNDQFEEPEIPVDGNGEPCAQMTAPLEYNVIEDNAILDQIYLPEANNKQPGDGSEPLVVVVGGIYNGNGLVENTGTNLSYYRIDMKDDKDATTDGVLAPFDIIRNHSYIFNITAVNNPGTPTPEEALDEAVVGLTVEVEDWTDEYMRGVPDQYTLTTDKSVITYEAYNDQNGQTIDIWTDYSDGWYIEWPGSTAADWLNISSNSGEDNVTTTITLTPKTDNNGVTRIANFYVVAGNIKKEITVRQPQPPTANCYVRGNGTYELIVSIKGNGNDGILPEGQDIVPGDGDASITPNKIGIIWETAAGLVTLNGTNPVTVETGDNDLVLYDYNTTTNTISYTVNTKPNGVTATIGGVEGGNALIGAFRNTGTDDSPVWEVIWSWHIWVSPDIIDPATQTIKEACVENWTLNDYDVLDRNLGALANRPIESQTDNTKSVASMGLLYQWGRKDPFIGAAYSNDNFPSTNSTGVLPVVHYYEDWNVEPITNNTTAINTTIAHPTHLIYGGTTNAPTGLSSMATNGGYLWGTNNGLSTTVKDLGSKTIYDPCPVGYRVPPVDAFVFAKKSTEEQYNYTYIETITLTPGASSTSTYGDDIWYKRKRSDRNEYGDYSRDDISEDGKIKNNSNNRTYNYQIYRRTVTTSEVTQFTSENTNWNENLIYIPHRATGRSTSGNIWYWSGGYVTNADYYGFWMNYTENSVPALKDGSYTDGEIHYELADYNNLTWLPLTGAYDPTKGFRFKDNNNNTIAIEQGSSITVNSFLWTNSSVSNGGNRIPGAMFLHGTEVNSNVNGRHIHGLTKSDIKAEPHYAGAVRCVRDRAKTKWDINSLTEEISISYGETQTINIVSVNANWELIDPGQPWLQVTPDKGTADKGQGTEITLKLLENVAAGSETTLVFKIANEMETRSCVVTVE